MINIPFLIPNWLSGREQTARDGGQFDKISPSTGELLWKVTRSQAADVHAAVEAARAAQPGWAEMPAVKRGEVLHRLVDLCNAHQEDIGRIVAAETGKSLKDAKGEAAGAASLGFFYASEGQRLYGRTTTSGQMHRQALTVRQPRGVAALIIAANTPIANVAWKVFPALICGNSAILKAAEDTPATAWFFGWLAREAGVPEGVLTILQGIGAEAGQALVNHADIDVISFTGSTRVGREIMTTAGLRLTRVSLELGGKNALVVCDDADLELAVKWTLLSVFSNAGQRCAAAGRIIVFDSIYERFRKRVITEAGKLKIGSSDEDDFGPVINERQLQNMLAAVRAAQERGGKILCGGGRLPMHGFHMAATLLEDVPHEDPLAQEELFGPIGVLFRCRDFHHALELTNGTAYGLTTAIHTRDINRALRFADQARTGVVTINGGTYGSEPHMPFGGRGQSGNGTREPGTEALDVYSELKNIYVNIDPRAV
ncbi:MAG: aldehyde dehydrogenase family protein [Verrucomicrobiota bacterium]|nr:aldehyde dehydrogenase family protein [Verrucomicrobiota bacterium]